ncbi:MAG: tetratricopeptide repeat protein [Acidobacteria bacterium]|nr:tetratricopeptide repeat protein [Acidobacteriota bacterium]
MLRKALLAGSFLLLLNGRTFGQVPPPQQTPPPQQRQPQVEEYSIRGKIVSSNVRATDERIEVRLERPGLQTIMTAFSDSIGNFEFHRIPGGMYYIVIEKEGFEPIRQEVEVHSTLGRTQQITVFLNPKVTRTSNPFTRRFEGEDPDVIDITQLNKNFPKKAVQEYEKALEDRRKGDSAKAMKRLEEAVKIAPDFYHALNNLGVLYQRASRYRDAEKVYRHASTLNPRASQPLINLGSLFIEEAETKMSESRQVWGKLLDDAMDILEQSIKMNPRSAVAYYYLGTAYYKSTFYEEAESNLKRAHQLDSTMGAVRLMLANVYIKQQRWQEVLEHLNLFLQENPNSADRPAVEELRAKIVKGLESPRK